MILASDTMPPELRMKVSAQLVFIQEFLDAAKKRLPSQAAIDKDKTRKRSGKKKAKFGPVSAAI